MKIKLTGILVIVLLSACHLTKSVMIKNETNRQITLILPSTQKSVFFNDAIKEIHLDAKGKKQDTVLWYGHGQWTDTEKDDLNALLHKSKMVIGKDTLPINDTRMVRYGLLIRELYVRIKLDKAKDSN